jgi:hypothetical protein
MLKKLQPIKLKLRQMKQQEKPLLKRSDKRLQNKLPRIKKINREQPNRKLLRINELEIRRQKMIASKQND